MKDYINAVKRAEENRQKSKEITELLDEHCYESNQLQWLAEQQIVESHKVTFYQIFKGDSFVGDTWHNDLHDIINEIADDIDIEQLKEALEIEEDTL